MRHRRVCLGIIFLIIDSSEITKNPCEEFDFGFALKQSQDLASGKSQIKLLDASNPSLGSIVTPIAAVPQAQNTKRDSSRSGSPSKILDQAVAVITLVATTKNSDLGPIILNNQRRSSLSQTAKLAEPLSKVKPASLQKTPPSADQSRQNVTLTKIQANEFKSQKLIQQPNRSVQQLPTAPIAKPMTQSSVQSHRQLQAKAQMKPNATEQRTRRTLIDDDDSNESNMEDDGSFSSTSKSIHIQFNGGQNRHHRRPKKNSLEPKDTKQQLKPPALPPYNNKPHLTLSNPLYYLPQKIYSTPIEGQNVKYEPRFVYKYQFESSPPEWVGVWDGKSRRFGIPPSTTVLHFSYMGGVLSRLDRKTSIFQSASRVLPEVKNPALVAKSVVPTPKRVKSLDLHEDYVISPDEFLIILKQTLKFHQVHHWKASKIYFSDVVGGLGQ